MSDEEYADEDKIALVSKCRNRECPAKRDVEGFTSTDKILASWRPRFQDYRCLWCDGPVETLETQESARGIKLEDPSSP